MNSFKKNPLYTLGFINGFIATGIWFISAYTWLFPTNVMFIHERLMAGGFFWSFIAGFILRGKNNKFEIFFSSLLILFMTGTSFMRESRFFYMGQLLLIVFLLFYELKKSLFLKDKIKNLSVHLTSGLILTIIGVYDHLNYFSLRGFHLYQMGGVLMILIGLSEAYLKKNKIIFNLVGVIMSILLFMSSRNFHLANLILGILFIYPLILFLRAFKTRFKYVFILLPLTFLLNFFYVNLFITWYHILFIGVFSSLIFMLIGEEITLKRLQVIFKEKKTVITWIIISLIGTIICRVLYGIVLGNVRKSFLHTAATFWSAAIILWWVKIYPLLLKEKE